MCGLSPAIQTDVMGPLFRDDEAVEGGNQDAGVLRGGFSATGRGGATISRHGQG